MTSSISHTLTRSQNYNFIAINRRRDQSYEQITEQQTHAQTHSHSRKFIVFAVQLNAKFIVVATRRDEMKYI